MLTMSRLVLVTGAVLLASCQGEPLNLENDDQPAPRLGAFTYVSVGVADLDAALELWRDQFALQVSATRAGPDAALASLWDIPADSISRQALVRTPALNTGALHLVEFVHPDKPVREGAAVFDRLPKNLDVYARDLPARYEEMRDAGYVFRAPWTEMPAPGGLIFREVQMAGHDATNIVLLEILDTDYSHSPAGYAGIGPLIIVVGDAEAETRFYADILGLEMIMEDFLAGPEIERMVGLPAGAGIDFRVLGDEADPMGRIEVIEYQRTGGEDRFDRARPPATGTLHAGWQVADLNAVRRHLNEQGIAFRDHGSLDTIYGTGPMISLKTPAGFRIEVQEPKSPKR
ncbi:MAG: VOC family protein [Gammaproteobacteria bacterium]